MTLNKVNDKYNKISNIRTNLRLSHLYIFNGFVFFFLIWRTLINEMCFNENLLSEKCRLLDSFIGLKLIATFYCI